MTPTVTLSAGYDGNYFYTEETALQEPVYPVQTEAGVDFVWLPNLRYSLGIGARAALGRLVDVGTMQQGEASLSLGWRPSLWSDISAVGWFGRRRAIGDNIEFLTGNSFGGQLRADRRFSWGSFGLDGLVDATAYGAPASQEASRTDIFIDAGPHVRWDLAGLWTLSLAYQQNSSPESLVRYRGGEAGLGYEHDLWNGALAELGVRYRQKNFEVSRVDRRVSGQVSLHQEVRRGAWISITGERAENASDLAGYDYSWTAVECKVTVSPSWHWPY